MFAIGDKEWPGVSKAVEEMGELLQVLGKLMGMRGNTNHWSGDLMAMLLDELADVRASLDFLAMFNKLDMNYIDKRYAEKLRLYREWHKTDPKPPELDKPKQDA